MNLKMKDVISFGSVLLLKNIIMKKLKIYPYVGHAAFPYSTKLEMVKITPEEAMTLDRYSLPDFEDWTARFEPDRWLKEAEFYKGYLAVRYGSDAIVVEMNGIIHKVPAAEAETCTNASLAKSIREGKMWRIVYPLINGAVCEGTFVIVKNLADYAFDEVVAYIRSFSGELKDVEAKAFNKVLHDKLTAGLLSYDHVIEVTAEEDRVLQVCLMRRMYESYFKPVL